MLALFPRLKERLTQRGGTLSGGEQQMLAIARALMSRPRLLLLDEPSLGLAPLIVRQIFDAIRKLNAEDGLTVFLVEQNAFHALKLAHRGYVMVNGLITLSGTGRELLDRPEVKSAYLEGGRQAGRAMMPSLSMQGFLHEEGSFGVFLLVTIILGGGAAVLAGRAIALTWRPWWQIVAYMLILGAAVRFIHFALFGGTLLSLHYYAVDSAICLAFGLIGFRPRVPRKWSANIAGSISRTAGCAGAASRLDVTLRQIRTCRFQLRGTDDENDHHARSLRWALHSCWRIPPPPKSSSASAVRSPARMPRPARR